MKIYLVIFSALSLFFSSSIFAVNPSSSFQDGKLTAKRMLAEKRALENGRGASAKQHAYNDGVRTAKTMRTQQAKLKKSNTF